MSPLTARKAMEARDHLRGKCRSKQGKSTKEARARVPSQPRGLHSGVRGGGDPTGGSSQEQGSAEPVVLKSIRVSSVEAAVS